VRRLACSRAATCRLDTQTSSRSLKATKTWLICTGAHLLSHSPTTTNWSRGAAKKAVSVVSKGNHTRLYSLSNVPVDRKHVFNAIKSAISLVTAILCRNGCRKTQQSPKISPGLWQTRSHAQNAKELLKRTKVAIIWLAKHLVVPTNSAGFVWATGNSTVLQPAGTTNATFSRQKRRTHHLQLKRKNGKKPSTNFKGTCFTSSALTITRRLKSKRLLLDLWLLLKLSYFKNWKTTPSANLLSCWTPATKSFEPARS